VGLPTLPDKLRLPADIRRFYELTGGATLFSSARYRFTIVNPRRFVRANPFMCPGLPESVCNEYPCKNWFIVSDCCITVDLNPERVGRCYGSLQDRHAVRGSSPIIAWSFTELLGYLLGGRGKTAYGTSTDFESQGDAFDDVQVGRPEAGPN
jgi:hypothetical protein